MKLTIQERLHLPGIFVANKNSVTEAQIKRSIIEVISISQDEANKIELQLLNNRHWAWDAKKAEEIDFDFSPAQTSYIRESIFCLSRSPDHDVTDQLLPICEKFMTF